MKTTELNPTTDSNACARFLFWLALAAKRKNASDASVQRFLITFDALSSKTPILVSAENLQTALNASAGPMTLDDALRAAKNVKGWLFMRGRIT